MRIIYLSILLIIFSLDNSFAINEQEPNNSFTNANLTIQDSVFNGVTCASEADYIVTKQKIAGTVEVVFTRTNIGTGNSYIYINIHDKNTNLIVSKLYYSNPFVQTSDTFRITCMNDDSVYFHLFSGACFNYSFKYRVIVPNYTNDNENNNGFTLAEPISYNTLTTGQVGFTKPSLPDPSDYFKGDLPDEGTLRVILETYNEGANNSYLYFNSYYKNTSGIKSNLYYSNPQEYRRDTILVPCLAKDSIYFYINTGTCFSYRFKYEVLAPIHAVEKENNNDRAGAVDIGYNTYQEGRINYTSSSFNDNIDYYKALLPENGTLRVIVDKTNNHTSNSYIYFNTYNKNGGSLNSSLYYQNPNSSKSDTILIGCVGADSVYFYVNTAICYSYKFKFDVIQPKYKNDQEPNNDIANATSIDFNSYIEGNSNFNTANFTDNIDYYKAIVPDNGKLRIMLERTNHHLQSNSYMYFNQYNKSGGSIQSSLFYSDPADDKLDTIYTSCIGADTIYFYINTGTCFSYKFKYDVILNTFKDEYKDNASLAKATPITALQNVSGDLNFYRYNVNTNTDYYKSLVPLDGTLKIKLKKVNHSNNNNWMYFYTHNKKGNVISTRLFYSDPNVQTLDSIYLNCIASDSIYFSLVTGNCFSYQFNYEIEKPLYDKDVEPNNALVDAIKIDAAEIKSGQIGYSSTLGTDDKDFY